MARAVLNTQINLHRAALADADPGHVDAARALDHSGRGPQYLGRRFLLQAVGRGSAAGHGQRNENASGRQTDGVLPDGVAGLLDQLV